MFKGLKADAVWSYRIKLESSLSGPQCASSGTLTTGFMPDYVAPNLGVYLSAIHNSDDDEVHTRVCRFQCPALGADELVTLDGDGDVELIVTLAMKVYAENTGVWSVTGTAAEWTINGSSYWSHGSFSIMSGTTMRPSAVPLIGLAPIVQAAAGTGQSYVYGKIPPGGYDPLPSASADCTVTGGYKMTIDGVDVALPINVSTRSQLSAGGHTPPAGTVGGSDTWTASLTASAYGSWGGTSASKEVTQAALLVTPQPTRKMVRLETGNGSLVRRGGMPAFAVTRSTTYDRSPSFDPDPIASATDSADHVSARADFRGIAGDTPGDLEENLSDDIPCLYALGGMHAEWSTGDQTLITDGLVNSLNAVGSFTTPNVANYLRNVCIDPQFKTWAAWCDTWAYPFWSYGLNPSTDTDFDPDELLQRSQIHLDQDELSEDPLYRRLSNIVAEGLDQNGLTGFWQEDALACPCPWGIDGTGMEVQTPAVPESLTLDERTEERWTFAGDGSIGGSGTGSVDSAAVNGDAGNTTFDFALGSYAVWPYMTSHLADRVTLSLVGAVNVAKLEAFLIGADGAAVKIGEIMADSSTFRFPRGTDTEWWVSGGQEFTSDTYTGVASSGLDASTGVASDAELATAMPFISFRAGSRIRFVATPTDSGSGVSFDHPVLLTGVRPEDADAVRPDAASLAILQTDGPAIRYGEESHYDAFLDAVVQDGIAVQPFDRKLECGDWLVIKRLWFEAKGWEEDLDTEIASIYEDGVEYTQRKHLWRDADFQRITHSFMLQGHSGPVGVMVQSYRAVPPMFPTRERLPEDDWQATGDWGMYSYTLDQTRQWHATGPGDGRGLFISDGDVLTYPTPVTGWRSGYHQIAVDASESFDWEVRSPPVLAKVKPYRGYLWDSDLIASLLKGSGYAVSRGWRHALAYSDGGTLKIRYAPNSDLSSWSAPAAGASAGHVRIAWPTAGSNDPLWATVVSDGAATLIRLPQEDGTSDMSIKLGSAASAAHCFGVGGTLFAFRLASGTIYGQAYDGNLSPIGAEWTTNLTGLDTDAISAASYVDSAGSLRIALLYVIGGTQTVSTSPDGITFA